jgi:AraC-like DNA-binding protein
MTTLVRAAGLEGFEDVAADVGLNVPRALQRVGLSRRSLQDPDGLIPYLAVIHLLEHAAREGNCLDFGQRLAARQDIGILGPLAVLLRHAPTVGEALALASRYLFVHSPAARFEVLAVPGRAAEVDLTFALDMPQLPPRRQTIELSLGLVVQGLRRAGAGQIAPLLALFPHAQGAPLQAYAATYGCECRFGAEAAAVRIAVADLQRSVAEHDPHIQALAQIHLAQHEGAPGQLVCDRVRAMVRRFLGAGQATQTNIAQAMAIHPRTLQRRLQAEGHCFEDLLDAIRREQFLDLILYPQPLSLTQIALMLGYSEQAALTRSCRRWFACTPSEMRQRR